MQDFSNSTQPVSHWESLLEPTLRCTLSGTGLRPGDSDAEWPQLLLLETHLIQFHFSWRYWDHHHRGTRAVLVLSCFSHVQLFATPWTVGHHAPLSTGLSRQEYWNGLLCPLQGTFRRGAQPRPKTVESWWPVHYPFLHLSLLSSLPQILVVSRSVSRYYYLMLFSKEIKQPL